VVVKESSPDGVAPFHLVNRMKHYVGPFTGYADAVLARHISEGIWKDATILDKDAFDAHLGRLTAEREENPSLTNPGEKAG
jgi:hypothetical protein